MKNIFLFLLITIPSLAADKDSPEKSEGKVQLSPLIVNRGGLRIHYLHPVAPLVVSHNPELRRGGMPYQDLTPVLEGYGTDDEEEIWVLNGGGGGDNSPSSDEESYMEAQRNKLLASHLLGSMMSLPGAVTPTLIDLQEVRVPEHKHSFPEVVRRQNAEIMLVRRGSSPTMPEQSPVIMRSQPIDIPPRIEPQPDEQKPKSNDRGKCQSLWEMCSGRK